MSRPRFLADHDLRERIVTGVCRRKPVDFIRARDLGLQRRSDPEVLGVAAEQGLIVVSHDVNTMSGHAYARIAAGQKMSGLLLAKQSGPTRPVIDSLLDIWGASEAEEWLDRVMFLPL